MRIDGERAFQAKNGKHRVPLGNSEYRDATGCGGDGVGEMD